MPISQVVPVLDLSQPIDAIAKVCRTACEEHGFFFIKNTGIPPTLVSDHADAQRRFFKLTEEQKRTILADENNRGYTPVYEQTLDPARSTQGDFKEGLYFGREIPSTSSEAALPLHGPNQWPDESLLPGYRQIVEEYIAAMYKLSMRMLPILSRALQLPSQDYLDQYFNNPMLFLRPLRYPKGVISNEELGQHAAGAHSDWGCLTILWTDGTPGLQILYKGEWVDVEVPESHAGDGSNVFIVNLGDMLERWTAGKFASTVHRVVNKKGIERYSCPFFFEPSPDALIAPLPGCDSSENGRDKDTYTPITALEYLLSRYKATHEGYSEKMKSKEPTV
jgi:isopenicillin N synthase-like dioxygenase